MNRKTLDIFATGGSIHVPVLNGDRLAEKTRQGDCSEIHSPHSNVHQPLVEDFAEAVLLNREPEVDGEAVRTVQQVMARIYRGAR